MENVPDEFLEYSKWFEQHENELIKEFGRDNFVAVYRKGEGIGVVLSGTNNTEILKQFYSKYGNQSVYVGKPGDRTVNEISSVLL